MEKTLHLSLYVDKTDIPQKVVFHCHRQGYRRSAQEYGCDSPKRELQTKDIIPVLPVNRLTDICTSIKRSLCLTSSQSIIQLMIMESYPAKSSMNMKPPGLPFLKMQKFTLTKSHKAPISAIYVQKNSIWFGWKPPTICCIRYKFYTK